MKNSQITAPDKLPPYRSLLLTMELQSVRMGLKLQLQGAGHKVK